MSLAAACPSCARYGRVAPACPVCLGRGRFCAANAICDECGDPWPLPDRHRHHHRPRSQP